MFIDKILSLQFIIGIKNSKKYQYINLRKQRATVLAAIFTFVNFLYKNAINGVS